jgi:hypothetical protein
MEAEARAIITAAVAAQRPAGRLGSYIHGQFARVGGVDLDVPVREEPARVADLE